MNHSDLKKLFVSGSFSVDHAGLDAVGIKDVIQELKKWYLVGEIESFWEPEDEDEETKYRWNQFMQFAGIASKIVRVVNGGEDIALVRVAYGDDVSNDNLNSESVRIIGSFS